MKRPLQLLTQGALDDVQKAGEKLRELGWDVATDITATSDIGATITLNVKVEVPGQGPRMLAFDPEKVAAAAGADLEQKLNEGRFEGQANWRVDES